MKEKDRGNLGNKQPKRLTEADINSPEFDPDEFAPAPSRNAAAGVSNMKNSLFFVILCAVCALVLALTNVFTVFAAEKGQKDIRRDAVLTLFPGCDRAELYDMVEDFPVYVAYYKGKLAGYAVYVADKGYIGSIEMLVAFDADNKVSQVQILSHKESEGLGSKIEGNKFLSQFVGMPDENISIDLISGATVSSLSVKDSVAQVLKLELDFLAIAEDLDVETISAAEMEDELQKEETAETTAATETTKVPSITTRPGDDTAFGGNNVGGANANTGDANNGSAQGEDDTTVYETETEEPGETTAEETTTDTQAPSQPPAVTNAPPVTTPPPVTTSPETKPPAESTTVPEETTGDVDTTAPSEETTGGGNWPGWG